MVDCGVPATCESVLNTWFGMLAAAFWIAWMCGVICGVLTMVACGIGSLKWSLNQRISEFSERKKFLR